MSKQAKLPTVAIILRISREWDRKIAEIAKLGYRTKASVIREAIGQYLAKKE